MKRTLILVATMLAAATLAGFGVATVTVGGTAAQAQVADGTRYYDFPADEKAAFNACFTTEREARNIPADLAAYRVWWAANEGTPAAADWTAANDACVAAHLWKHGKWNFDYMILVGSN